MGIVSVPKDQRNSRLNIQSDSPDEVFESLKGAAPDGFLRSLQLAQSKFQLTRRRAKSSMSSHQKDGSKKIYFVADPKKSDDENSESGPEILERSRRNFGYISGEGRLSQVMQRRSLKRLEKRYLCFLYRGEWDFCVSK